MSLLILPAGNHQHAPPAVDDAVPRRSKVTGGLAALACAACCALPLLITAGVLTGAGAAILERVLLAVSAGLAALALGMWWTHRRRAAVSGPASCGAGGCGC